MTTGKDHGTDERGQAAVELALVLPVVVLLALIVLQAGLVAKDFVLVQHAAREAARAGAVQPDGATVRQAAIAGGGLVGDRTMVRWQGGRRGDRSTATVTYSSSTAVPLVGRLIGDVTLSAQVSIRIE